jgi:acyl-CoA thioester hydrolase
MFYELRSPAGLHAKIKTVQVGVDVVTKKSRRLSDAEREYLIQYQELDDPAI